MVTKVGFSAPVRGLASLCFLAIAGCSGSGSGPDNEIKRNASGFYTIYTTAPFTQGITGLAADARAAGVNVLNYTGSVTEGPYLSSQVNAGGTASLDIDTRTTAATFRVSATQNHGPLEGQGTFNTGSRFRGQFTQGDSEGSFDGKLTGERGQQAGVQYIGRQQGSTQMYTGGGLLNRTNY